MRIILSRKGFDSAAGGCPSPIINGVPVSLPIPSGPSEPYRYRDISHPMGNMGDIVYDQSNGRVRPNNFAHADPVLPPTWGQAVLGQAGAANAHLKNQHVQPGDVFVFFGLFNSPTQKPHHRIFGMMTLERIVKLTENGGDWKALGLKQPHPHTERKNQNTNNSLYIGYGKMATGQHTIKMSQDTIPSFWSIPPWLYRHGLSYHGNKNRWTPTTLKLVNRGQEFVSDVGNDPEAKDWLKKIEKSLG